MYSIVLSRYRFYFTGEVINCVFLVKISRTTHVTRNGPGFRKTGSAGGQRFPVSLVSHFAQGVLCYPGGFNDIERVPSQSP